MDGFADVTSPMQFIASTDVIKISTYLGLGSGLSGACPDHRI